MATTKPTKPTNLMPRHFADDGIKNNFSSTKISNGFSSNFDDILQGDNLNYMIDSIGKELQYLSTVVDFIVDMPINKTFKVNANNNLEYVSLVEDASNKANISLDNLNTAGQAKFDGKANTDLSNLSATGNAKLDNKANINLSNLTTAGQARVIGLGMLDWNNRINTKPVGSGNAYTAVTPCVYVACMQAPYGSAGGSLYVNGIKYSAINQQDGYNQNVSVYLPLDTGDSIYWSKSLGSVISAIVPFKGVS